MIVAGIDPGKTGALFLYDPNMACHTCVHVPVIAAGPKGKIIPDFTQWAQSWLYALLQVDHVFIEQVGAMPGQGVTSMFSFGYSAGFALGLVTSLRKPHTFITPQAWKKIVGLSGSDGEQSRRRASQLLPECATLWPLKKHDGRAEAALIAYAGYRKLTEGTTDGRSLDRRGTDLPAASVGKGRKPAKGSGGSRMQQDHLSRRHTRSSKARADGQDTD